MYGTAMGNTERKLPFLTKLMYGAGELGPNMAGGLLILLQLNFLTDVAGLTPGLAGIVLLVGKVWDAVNDPLVGWLSDRTRSKWGRRLPWIVYSAVPFALAQFFMWIVPQFGSEPTSQTLLFWYYVAIAIFFNMLYTMVTLPYAALTPELSQDYDERTSISSYRQLFALGGVLGGNILSFFVFSLLKSQPMTEQYKVLAGGVSIVLLIGLAISLVGIWRTVAKAPAAIDPESDPVPSMPVWEQVRVALSNGPYLSVCAIYLCSWLAMQFTASILKFYVESWLGLTAADASIVALTVFGTAVLLLPLFAHIATHHSKKLAYFVGMIIWIMAQAGLFFLQPGRSVLLYVLCVMAGFGICVTYLIPNAMVPDTIELDELRTGQRREGIFYGLFVFIQKIVLAVGTAILGLILEASGYIEGGIAQQPESALFALRIAIGPLPACALVLGLIFTWYYPITRERHAEILAQLAAKKAGTT
jgi:GPH family glycoside/pentoside/hexuronide:cation symporter